MDSATAFLNEYNGLRMRFKDHTGPTWAKKHTETCQVCLEHENGIANLIQKTPDCVLDEVFGTVAIS